MASDGIEETNEGAHEPAAAEDGKLARLRALAEQEMRRRLPADAGGGPPPKRHKAGGGIAGSAEAAAVRRYDYGAVQELASGVAGFLLTCALQRENSARKEVGPLLIHYLQQCTESGGGGQAGSAAAGGSLAAIKIACRGVVALKLAAHDAAEGGSASSSDAAAAALVRQVAAALLADIDSGEQQRLQHVQRIIPIQTTCQLERGALQAAGARLSAVVAAGWLPAAQLGNAGAGEGQHQAAIVAGDSTPCSQQRSIKFGIAVKHRQLPEVAGAKLATPPGAAAGPSQPAAVGDKPAAPSTSNGDVAGSAAASTEPPAMDRGAIIASLASGFEAALREEHDLQAAVDLKAPDVVLVVEVLPAGGALYAALCALPQALCVLKPKLHIRPVGKMH